MTTTTARGLPSLRAANRRLIVDELQRRGEISRAELARNTQLSGTTVSSLIAELVADGLVAETGANDRGSGRTGRPARLLRLLTSRTLVAGMELGHSSIRAAVSDLAGNVLTERTMDWDVDADGQRALEAAADLLSDAIAADQIDRSTISRLAVGIPGFIAPATGMVISGRMGAWSLVNPAQVLQSRTGFPTSIENDADLAVLGEQMFGAARGLQDVVFVKVSAGIGAGLMLGGRLYRAAEGGAGEIGHIQVNESGAICSCGNRGCLETVVSVPQALTVLADRHPAVASPTDIVTLAQQGDRATVRVISDMGRTIGRPLADLCNVLAPQVVVVGGDLVGALDPLVDSIAQAIDRYTQPRAGARIRVVPTELDHRAGILGAVAAAIADHPLLVA